jgi:small subunit ribosomal protein S4
MGPRVTPPGQHGAARKKATDYSLQLREKQKCKRFYGLLEKQFHSYYAMAENMRGVTGENMLSLIERRLDNVVFRAHLGVSRAQARQIVNHGLITVNGKIVNIPSYMVKVGDVISVKKSKKDKLVFDGYQIPANCPAWLTITTGEEASVAEVKVNRLPIREDCEQSIREHLIVELYSK